jgi:hypothetical protein
VTIAVGPTEGVAFIQQESSDHVGVSRRPVQIERFSTAAAFRQRVEVIEAGLSEQQWQSKGQPAILPDGWPDKIPSQ